MPHSQHVPSRAAHTLGKALARRRRPSTAAAAASPSRALSSLAARPAASVPRISDIFDAPARMIHPSPPPPDAYIRPSPSPPLQARPTPTPAHAHAVHLFAGPARPSARRPRQQRTASTAPPHPFPGSAATTYAPPAPEVFAGPARPRRRCANGMSERSSKSPIPIWYAALAGLLGVGGAYYNLYKAPSSSPDRQHKLLLSSAV